MMTAYRAPLPRAIQSKVGVHLVFMAPNATAMKSPKTGNQHQIAATAPWRSIRATQRCWRPRLSPARGA